jgi:hypothetical protein
MPKTRHIVMLLHVILSKAFWDGDAWRGVLKMNARVFGSRGWRDIGMTVANGVGSGVDGIGRVGISLWIMGLRRPEAVMRW